MTPRQRVSLAAVVFALGLAIAAVMLLPRFLRSELRRALPSSATEIHETEQELLHFRIRYLKARIAEADFPAYVKALNLKPYVPDPNNPGDMQNWSRMDTDPAWWTPPEPIAGTYSRERGEKFVCAKYAEGWLWAGAIE